MIVVDGLTVPFCLLENTKYELMKLSCNLSLKTKELSALALAVLTVLCGFRMVKLFVFLIPLCIVFPSLA